MNIGMAKLDFEVMITNHVKNVKKKDILLGVKSENSVNSSLCNSLILAMKYYIYVMKIKKVTPTF